MKKVVSMRNFVAAAMLGIICAGGGWFAWHAEPADAANPPIQGGMQKFTPTNPPQPVPELAFVGPDGARVELADFKGKVVLLNLWATWCAPCVKEMPALDNLQSRLGGEDFEVVALSLDRGGRKMVEPFFEKLGVKHLAIYLDPQSTAMSALKPRGLPTTILIDRQGYEVGRLEGEAAWDGADAERLLKHYLDTGVRPPAMMRTRG
jgi:thiol-disulfide isomerase/thioredoxin